MRESIVMTLIGRDRTGLVESLAAIIEEHGGNWEESRMVQLAGEFAGLLHIQVPADRTDELERALNRLDGISVVVVHAAREPVPGATIRSLELEVLGQDRPGIVRRLAEAIAGRGINIEELESQVLNAPMSGEPMFQVHARLRAPRHVELEHLEELLERVASDLMVDVRLQEPAADSGGG